LSTKPQDPAVFLQNFAQDGAALAESRGCVFVYSHAGNGSADFEAGRLRQVLLNLVSNALKVSPAGARIALDSKLDSELWQVSVADEGPGLDQQRREKMFDPFVRFPAAEESDEHGSGLGLTICRSIITLHQGQIVAEPGPNGKGLRIAFEIPVINRAGALAA